MLHFWFFVAPMVSLLRSLTRLRELLVQKKALLYSKNSCGPFPLYTKLTEKLPEEISNAVAVDQKLEQVEKWYNTLLLDSLF